MWSEALTVYEYILVHGNHMVTTATGTKDGCHHIHHYSASMLRIQKVKHQCTCILHIFPLIGVYEHAFFKCRDFENVINMLFMN